MDGTLDKDMLRLFLRDGAADLDADAGDDHGALSIRTAIQTGLLSVRASIYREVAEVMTQEDHAVFFVGDGWTETGQANPSRVRVA